MFESILVTGAVDGSQESIGRLVADTVRVVMGRDPQRLDDFFRSNAGILDPGGQYRDQHTPLPAGE